MLLLSADGHEMTHALAVALGGSMHTWQREKMTKNYHICAECVT
jgi:hypothetical protein